MKRDKQFEEVVVCPLCGVAIIVIVCAVVIETVITLQNL